MARAVIMTESSVQGLLIGNEPRLHRLHHEVNLLVGTRGTRLPHAVRTKRVTYVLNSIGYRTLRVDEKDIQGRRLCRAESQEVLDGLRSWTACYYLNLNRRARARPTWDWNS